MWSEDQNCVLVWPLFKVKGFYRMWRDWLWSENSKEDTTTHPSPRLWIVWETKQLPAERATGEKQCSLWAEENNMKLKPSEKNLEIKGVWLMRDPENQRAQKKGVRSWERAGDGFRLVDVGRVGGHSPKNEGRKLECWISCGVSSGQG